MMNAAEWKPSKFVLQDETLRANGDAHAVAISSRLNVDLLGSALLPLIRSHARGRILDLGCGEVPLYAAYAPHCSNVTCVDWPHSGHGLRHADLECDLSEPLPLPDGCCDTVLLTDVLEHLPEPARLTREVRRVLAPGGVLLGSVPFMYRLHEEPHDHYRYTRHALTRLAAAAGFSINHLAAYGSGTDVLFDILAKLVVDAHWRWGPRLADWAHRGGLRMRGSRLGRHLNQGTENMPLGYVFAWRVEAGPR